MRGAIMLSLDVDILARLHQCTTQATQSDELAIMLGLYDSTAIEVPLMATVKPIIVPKYDEYFFTPDKYKELQKLVKSTKTGYDLLNYAALHDPNGKAFILKTRHEAGKVLKRAARPPKPLKAPKPAKRPVINLSRVAEALLLKGLESFDVPSIAGGSTRRNAAKATDQPANE
jgi:hypothetical protein